VVTRSADLHTHSNASDGQLAPADLLEQAARRGLSILALTDHDTTLGLPEAADAASTLGIRFIPGIELSTDVERGEIHILGYGVDPNNSTLQRTLARLRESRESRIERMLDRLEQQGMTLPRDQIRASAAGASVGRPHIARAMIDAGYVSTISEAFARYLDKGKPAYIAAERLTPVEAVRLIRDTGGLPVHAHPFSSPDFPASLPALIDAGLVGLEAYYGEYSEPQRNQIATIASQYGLLATGGSDFHGVGFKEGRDLGGVTLPADVIDLFLARLSAQSGASQV
jgi:predicted metal-dependent phosphoesterase TrpH